MSVPVIESKTAGTWTASTTPYVLTKPTGLAVSDTMLAFMLTQSDTGSSVSAPSTPSGWTLVNSFDANATLSKLRVFAKVADSGDTAASDFSFTVSSGSNARSNGILFRLSNVGTPSLMLFASPTGSDTSGDSAFSGTISTATTYSDCLLMQMWFGYNSTGTPTVSGYTISGTNPTWTEEIDVNYIDSKKHFFSLASAPLPTARTVTSLSATASLSITDAFYLFTVLPPVTNTNVNLDLLSLSGVPQEPALSGGANITLDLVSFAMTPNDVSAEGSMAKWGNQTKNSSTWTNQDKS